MTSTPKSGSNGTYPNASRSTQSSRRPSRTTVAGLLGVLGAVMLAGGTGFAYAASTDVETGYLTVVDEGAPSTSVAANGDCPSGSAGGLPTGAYDPA